MPVVTTASRDTAQTVGEESRRVWERGLVSVLLGPGSPAKSSLGALFLVPECWLPTRGHRREGCGGDALTIIYVGSEHPVQCGPFRAGAGHFSPYSLPIAVAALSPQTRSLLRAAECAGHCPAEGPAWLEKIHGELLSEMGRQPSRLLREGAPVRPGCTPVCLPSWVSAGSEDCFTPSS